MYTVVKLMYTHTFVKLVHIISFYFVQLFEQVTFATYILSTRRKNESVKEKSKRLKIYEKNNDSPI